MQFIDIYFVLVPHTLLLDLSGPAEVFAMANRCRPLDQAGRQLHFRLHYVSASAQIETSIGLPLQGLAPLPQDLDDAAMVFVVGSIDNSAPVPGSAAAKLTARASPNAASLNTNSLNTNSLNAPPLKPEVSAQLDATVAWLKQVANGTRRIACICSGALLAARAGLLDGRMCTTHHSDCVELQALAPRAKVLDNRLFVCDGPISTSAGVTAGIDLALQIAADLCGAALAATVARNLVVYARRSGHDPQLSPWLAGRNHLHPALHRVQDAIAADPARPWTLSELAAIACSSERHLARLFRDYADTNALDYIHRLRIALARELLAQSSLDLERIAERAGFGSARQLRRVWQKFDTQPPGQWRQDHARSAKAAPLS